MPEQNPRKLQVGYMKDARNPFRMKCYYPIVGRISRKHAYRTATEAKARALQIFTRWCRLHDAALVAMMKGDEPMTDGALVGADSASAASPSPLQIIPEANHER